MYMNHEERRENCSHFHIFNIDNILSDFINQSCSNVLFLLNCKYFPWIRFLFIYEPQSKFCYVTKIRVAIYLHKQNFYLLLLSCCINTEQIVFERCSFIWPKKLQKRMYHFKTKVHFKRSYYLNEVWLHRDNRNVKTTI